MVVEKVRIILGSGAGEGRSRRVLDYQERHKHLKN